MRRELIVALALLALVFVAALLVPHASEQPEPSRASGDVGSGGYAAWYELLQREGVAVTRFRAPHEALGDERLDTLIVALPGPLVPSRWDGREAEALNAWVRAGGRLVAIGPLATAGDAITFTTLRSTDRAWGSLGGPWARAVGTLDGRGDDRLDRRANAGRTLLADHAGPLVVRRREGRGEIVAVAVPAPFENVLLGDAGNARLAYLLGRPRTPNGLVAFDEAVRGDVVDRPWYRALDVREQLLLAFLALAGLAWLAYGVLPLGPPVTLVAPREPTSAEFVDAFAALYGRARARDRARDALLADATRRLERAPRSAANQELALQVDAARERPVSDDRALVALAALTRSVREETTRGGDRDRSGPLARGARARHRRR